MHRPPLQAALEGTAVAFSIMESRIYEGSVAGVFSIVAVPLL